MYATGSTPLEGLEPGWHSWQSDTGLWWATRRGRYRNPMTLGPAHDAAELAGIVEREDGCQAGAQGQQP